MEIKTYELAGYNRIAAGKRIQNKRMIMGLTQDVLAEKIGLAYKYCQDIERGTSGMSIDTMLSITSCLNISLDYLIYGNNEDSTEFTDLDIEQQSVIENLGYCSFKKKDMLWIS